MSLAEDIQKEKETAELVRLFKEARRPAREAGQPSLLAVFTGGDISDRRSLSTRKVLNGKSLPIGGRNFDLMDKLLEATVFQDRNGKRIVLRTARQNIELRRHLWEEGHDGSRTSNARVESPVEPDSRAVDCPRGTGTLFASNRRED